MIEAIKKGINITTKNLQLVLIVYAISVIFGLISIPFVRRIGTIVPGAGTTIPFMFWLIAILSFFVQIFVMGGVLGCVHEAVKKGAANIGQFVNFGKNYYVRLLLSGLLGFVIALVYGLIFAALVGGITAGGTVIKIILGTLLAIYLVFGIALALMLVFWPYAIIAEDIGVIEALKKSIEISRNPISNLCKILGMILLLIIAAFLVNLIISLPQALFNQLIILLQLYRIIIVGAVGAFLNVAIVSALMAYYFTLKGEGSAQGPASTVT